MASFFRLLTEMEAYALAIFVYNRAAKTIVSQVLKRTNVQASYRSGAEMKRDTGKNDTPRFVMIISREEGNNLINAIEQAVKQAGFGSTWDAGIEIYFD